MSTKQGFDKKIFNVRLLFSDLGFLLMNLGKTGRAFRNEHITRALAERIMMVTSAVNGCVYCSWLHANQALKSGISEEEVMDLMNLQFHTDTGQDEVMALLYAQHFAETDRKPEPEMKIRLSETYGDQTAEHINLVIRMVFFGNLYGNTWDAVLSRLKGQPAWHSSLLFESLFLLMSFWFMIPVMLIVKRKKIFNAH